MDSLKCTKNYLPHDFLYTHFSNKLLIKTCLGGGVDHTRHQIRRLECHQPSFRAPSHPGLHPDNPFNRANCDVHTMRATAHITHLIRTRLRISRAYIPLCIIYKWLKHIHTPKTVVDKSTKDLLYMVKTYISRNARSIYSYIQMTRETDKRRVYIYPCFDWQQQQQHRKG